ncbi:MAG TPA: 5-oxoprolinase subunit PxpB [Candidatus Limnocylindrales bacterium]|nr:5-oxoprolinase subunit PxpB [Candidatus Limnocylindrales bacterium]
MIDGGQLTVRPFGEAALLVELGRHVDPALNARTVALMRVIAQARANGQADWLGAPVHAYASLLLPFDPRRVEARDVEEWLRARADHPAYPDLGSAAPLEIPVRYGGENGPDLEEVAGLTGLTPEEVVRLHGSVDYRVYMLGFAPGFAYLGELPEQLELPRRDTPRPRVPAGSVAIAVRQTAVYPLATPGGWHIIGRTDLSLWEPQREPPALIEPGWSVRFRAA